MIVVVGGPQYRVGSHRQFVLLGRALASQGIAVLRFDLTGMGDSVGQAAGFEHCGKDVRDATSFLLESVAGLDRVCLWGLCDGASASLLYGRHDPRVGRMVLLNPWVRTEAGLAQAYLDTYYTRRLRSRAFWMSDAEESSSAGALDYRVPAESIHCAGRDRRPVDADVRRNIHRPNARRCK